MASKFDRVFVVTYGRSGSTLLQGLLNAIPGYRIYGENAGFLFKLQDAYYALLDANKHLQNPNNDNPSQPWFGSSRFDEASVTVSFRQFANKMLFQPQTNHQFKVFGFKEIRFNEINPERIERYIEFISRLFPRYAIIFNTRNVEDVLKSGWWRRNYWPGLPKQFADFHEFAERFAEQNAEHAIHIRYDAFVSPDRLEVSRLLEFLGEQLSEEAIDGVFSSSHSYENRSLTEYLSGRSSGVELVEPSWWRENVDEFRIEVSLSEGGYALTGVLVPGAGTGARIFIGSEERSIEILGTTETPKVASLFTANPAASRAGFRLREAGCEALHLYGESSGFPRALVGLIRPSLAAAHGRADAPTAMTSTDVV